MTTQDDIKAVVDQITEMNALVQEVAEDMEDVLKIIGKLEKRQTTYESRLDQLIQEINGKAATDAREISRLRKELLEEQDSLMGVSLFNLIVPTLDSLNNLSISLDETHDQQIYGQVQSLLVMLESLLRRVHITSFSVSTGDDFDPQRMRCVGFVESEIEGVVKITQLGYQIDDKILRQASVLVNQNLQQ